MSVDSDQFKYNNYCVFFQRLMIAVHFLVGAPIILQQIFFHIKIPLCKRLSGNVTVSRVYSIVMFF